MDSSLIIPFIKAAMETFQKLCRVEIKVTKPELKKGEGNKFDISGAIGLGGDVQGMVTMGFKHEQAKRVVSAFLGTDITEEAPEYTDGIGELVNIIAGYSKQFLPNLHISISLPQVVVGQEHILGTINGVTTYCMIVDSPFGQFIMEVSLKVN